ncbi:MAG: DUF1269 domain-containing protein [Thermomicrobiales bacterium]|nr:DUF1269 domain-containing protein [Thermomicrobiales bacterium]
MPFAPLELIVVRFSGEQVSSDVVSALRELVENGTIRIVDLVFARKNAQGEIAWSEAAALGKTLGLDDIASGLTEMLSEDDIEVLTAAMAPGSSAGVMLFENVWAQRFSDAVRASGGELVLSERIPGFIIDELQAALEELEEEETPV